MKDELVGPLDRSIGYMLKQVTAALRAAMTDALRPLGLSVPQYVCLELLERSPGLSNADLARGAFVSRQSMNTVLRGLQDRRLVRRPSHAEEGRARPTDLTADGRRLLRRASTAVRAVEKQLVEPLSATDQRRMLAHLTACATAIRAEAPPVV